MSEVQKHEPGMFCWEELATTDAEAAKAFYCGLFGWEAHDQPASEGMVYTILRLNGKDVGALYGMGPDPGQPTHWSSYVAVESADRAAEKAESLGGQVLMAPFDVMEAGRMAIIKDSTGAVFSVWQPRNHRGAQVVNETGAHCWTELGTADTARAQEFYTGLFGWTAQTQQMEMGSYTVFHHGGRQAAGMYELSGPMAGVPPHWMPYFAVEDADATADKAKSLGATIQAGPQDIPGIGRFALIQDPQGAMFSIIRMQQPAS